MRQHAKLGLLWLVGVSMLAGAVATAASAADKAVWPDPELTIPWCKTPPKIDGKLDPAEWQYAAAVSMFGWPVMRQEQPVFYVCRDATNLYVAMASLDSGNNGVVASSTMHDNIHICGDDILELMVGPGDREAVKLDDFASYYIVVNSIGTLWDCKFIPLRDEEYNSWESGATIGNEVDGTYWGCELAIPLVSICKDLPKDGTVWRMNFDRTYFSYEYNAWVAGSLNDARCGGNVTFDSAAPAVRLLGVNALVDGKLKVTMEVANGTDKEQKVRLTLKCSGQNEKTSPPAVVGEDNQDVTVAPGQVKEVMLGNGRDLAKFNRVELAAVGADGKRLLAMQREVDIPAPRLTKSLMPKVPLVYIFPRFLPSLERLAVLVDYTAWAKKTGATSVNPTAEIKVFKKGDEAGQPVIQGTLTEFKNCQGTWRGSTKDLPEGEYVVKVKVQGGGGAVLADYDDWFEKRIFDWMKHPRGVGDAVPELYAPLTTKRREITLWGRTYAFGADGLPERVTSQGQELLNKKVELVAEVDGKPVDVKVVKPFAVISAKPAKVESRSTLAAGNLNLELECTTEYDGFMLYRLTYGPQGDKARISTLR